MDEAEMPRAETRAKRDTHAAAGGGCPPSLRERLGGDLKSRRAIRAKGLLFLFIALAGGALTLLEETFWLRFAALLACVWGACRFYYFLFYVLEHYAGDGPYVGLWHLTTALRRKRNDA